MVEQPSNVDYLTAIRPVQLYLRDSGGMAEQTTGPIGNIYRVLSCRFVAAPGVLEDPDFEVPFLVIHTVKIYEKSVEGAQCLALPYGIVGMSENIQDFW